MLHDPAVYENPSEFRPERHIATDSKPAERDPVRIVFGFGRRFEEIECNCTEELPLTVIMSSQILSGSTFGAAVSKLFSYLDELTFISYDHTDFHIRRQYSFRF